MISDKFTNDIIESNQIIQYYNWLITDWLWIGKQKKNQFQSKIDI